MTLNLQQVKANPSNPLDYDRVLAENAELRKLNNQLLEENRKLK
jgi:hypothetical protein